MSEVTTTDDQFTQLMRCPVNGPMITDAFREWEKTHKRENYGRCDAFAAGAAWHHEQGLQPGPEEESRADNYPPCPKCGSPNGTPVNHRCKPDCAMGVSPEEANGPSRSGVQIQVEAAELSERLRWSVRNEEKCKERFFEIQKEKDALEVELSTLRTRPDTRVAELEGHIKAIADEWYHSGKRTMPAALSAAIDALQAQHAGDKDG